VFFLPRKESAEAPPTADEARRFRGSAPVGGREQRTGTGWRNGDGRKTDLFLFADKPANFVRQKHPGMPSQRIPGCLFLKPESFSYFGHKFPVSYLYKPLTESG